MDTIDLKGFAPDLSPLTQGIFADCENVIPTKRGFEPLPSKVAKYSPLPGPCMGGHIARYTDGSSRVVAATKRYLWLLTQNGFVDATRASATGAQQNYEELASINRWRFAQFGNYTIAVNGVEVPQILTGDSNRFRDLKGGPPHGKFVEAVGYFLFICAPTKQTNQWWCSGIGDAENWTTDLSSQSANGQLTATPGPITAVRALGEQIVFYKERGTYLGQYVGPPFVWQIRPVSTEAGAIGNEAVVSIADAHVVVGDTQFYLVNGAGPPQKLDTPLTQWFFLDELDRRYQDRIVGWWDRNKDTVFFHYPSKSAATAGTLDKWIAWNMESNRWTRGSMDIELALTAQEYRAPATTYDGFFPTQAWDSLQNEGYEDPSFNPGTDKLQAVFGTDHQLYSLTGTPGASSITTSDLGDPASYIMVRRLRPNFSRFPTSPAAAKMYLKDNLGATLRSGQGAILNRDTGWVNLRQAARLHRVKFSFVGDYEIMSFGYDVIPQGTR